MDTALDFGSWLRHARSRQDMTQDSLAEAVGCATQTIRSFEIGRRRPSREMVARIVDVLSVPATEREHVVRLARAPLGQPEPVTEPPQAAREAPLRPAPITTTLIGRQTELTQLRQAMLAEGRRLVTLLGPGGIGKTCLAQQTAADLADHFAGGAAFVALATVTDASNLITAIAKVVGCPLAGTQNPEADLHSFLSNRELLLVLDNLEQLLGPEQGQQIVATLSTIVEQAPGVRLLITSRERLRVRDEWVIVVDGLTLPDDRPGAAVERSPAALLFLERARQVDASFALTPHNRGDVARVCRLLGGVPLAIELAAAWVRVLSCAEIAAEVARDVDFLSGGHRDLPDRHRSLRAVLDQSWHLLAPDEQRLLAHLAVFSGSCRREAIVAVLSGPTSGAAVLALLATLVDTSLVRRTKDTEGTTRYDLHEFVRQYAAARLAEEPAVADEAQTRHAAYYAAWLATQEAGLKSGRQRVTGETISVEIANVRAAWRWACVQQNAAWLRQMIPSLDWFYELRGWYDEAADAFTRVTEALQVAAGAPNAPEATQSCYWLAYGRAGFHKLRRDPAFAVRRLAESVAQLRAVSTSGEQIHCLKGLAYVKMFAGDYASAEALLDEACSIAEVRSDEWNLAMTLVIRGVMEALRSEAQTARQHLTEALAIARGVGDPRPISMALTYLGLMTLASDRAAEAEQFVREAHLLAAEHQDRFQISQSLQALGRIAMARDEYAEARWLLTESLAVAREIGDRWLEAQALGCLAQWAIAQDDPIAARANQRAALTAAAGAPVPIALDQAATLAEIELEERPGPALAALAYVRRHPLTRPATRRAVEQRWSEAARRMPPEQLVMAEAAAGDIPIERPTALLMLV